MSTHHSASINDLNLYYEIHGKGQPLILLHGGLGAIAMFESILPSLAEHHQVIAVELQGHAHTADIDRPFTYEAMADDIAALLKHLALPQADILGYSLGGGVALQTAIRHPQLIRKLILVSTPCKRQGWYPEVLAGMSAMNADAAQLMVGSPMHQAYAAAAPRPEDFPVLVEKTGQLLRQVYDWSTDFAVVPAPTLLIFGDADSVRPEHIIEMFQLRGGGKQDAGWDGSGMSQSRLAILPSTTHYSIFASPLLASVVIPFLDN
jgi:pimeloyl-ACP methyl ester carboxylesterase